MSRAACQTGQKSVLVVVEFVLLQLICTNDHACIVIERVSPLIAI